MSVAPDLPAVAADFNDEIRWTCRSSLPITSVLSAVAALNNVSSGLFSFGRACAVRTTNYFWMDTFAFFSGEAMIVVVSLLDRWCFGSNGADLLIPLTRANV